MAKKQLIRCGWCGDDPLYMDYHDNEWGKPLHDDTRLFEMLILEGAQAGLSWITILRKRQGYRAVFDGFDYHINAAYSDEQLEKKLLDSRIVRNRLKVFAVRKNAQAILKVIAEFGSFDSYIWQFVGGEPIVNHYQSLIDVPAKTTTSDVMSKDLKKRGFSFVGSTICYAYMQAVGMVNDHIIDCDFR